MDILFRMRTRAIEIKQLQGIKIGQHGPVISHLFFTDDAMFFFQASEPNCTVLKATVTRFCRISDQMLNLRKSFAKFSPNIPTELQSTKLQGYISNGGAFLARDVVRLPD